MSRTISILTLTVSFILLCTGTTDAQQIDPIWSNVNYANNDGNVRHNLDISVPFNQSELPYQALEPLFDSTGTEITLFPVDGAGHGFGSTMNEETFTMMADLFDRTINPSTAIKNAALSKKTPAPLLKYYVNPNDE